MPIDPSIPLRIQAPTLASPFEIMGQLGQLKAQQHQARAMDLQARAGEFSLGEAQDAQQRQDQIRAILAQAQGDITLALPQIAMIDPNTAASLRKQASETELAHLALAEKKNGILTDAFKSFLSPEVAKLSDAEKAKLWDSTKASLQAQYNIPTAAIGDYAPGKAEFYANRAVSMDTLWKATHPEAVKIGPGDTLVRPPVQPGGAPEVLAQGSADPKAIETWGKAIGTVAPQITSQASLDALHAEMDDPKNAFPAFLKGRIPTVWTPDVPKQLENLGMTAGERSTATNAASQRQLGWAQLAETVRNHKELEEGTSLTPEAVDKMADMFAITGTLPPLGQGRAAAGERAKIIARSVEKYPDVAWGTNAAEYKADASSLTHLQGTIDSVTAFENTFKKNLEVFKDSAKKLVDSGSPLLNKPMRDVQQNALGGSDVPVFNTARSIALTEFAKIMTTVNAGGVLSDSARAETDKFIPESATLKQVYDVVNTLLKDVKNRGESFEGQRDTILKRMEGIKSGGVATPPPPAFDATEVSAILKDKGDNKPGESYHLRDGSWWSKHGTAVTKVR